MSDPVEILPTKEVENEVEVTKEANALLATGKKHFFLKDFEEALSYCGQACSLLAEQYGDTAFECGDAYHLYGKVLLEVARMEAGVLGDAVAPAESDEEEDSDDTEDGEEQGASSQSGDIPMKVVCEASEGSSGNNENSKVSGVGKEGVERNLKTDEKMDTSDMKVDVSNNEKTEASMEGKAEANTVDKTNVNKNEMANDAEKSDNKTGDEKDVDEFEDEGEDLSTLKHAWEMLEMAKIIFNQQVEDKDVHLKLADVHLHLGLIGLESETYDIAINDISCCLSIQKEHLPENDRLIAETYFNLGMAYALNSNISASLEAYSKSLGILEKKIKSLEKTLSEETPEEKDVIESELEELKTIIPEVQEKIKELDDVKSESLKLARKLLESECGMEKGETSETTGDGNKETKVALNISHLVRKKRKAAEDNQPKTNTEEVLEESLPSKMQKTE